MSARSGPARQGSGRAAARRSCSTCFVEGRAQLSRRRTQLATHGAWRSFAPVGASRGAWILLERRRRARTCSERARGAARARGGRPRSRLGSRTPSNLARSHSPSAASRSARFHLLEGLLARRRASRRSLARCAASWVARRRAARRAACLSGPAFALPAREREARPIDREARDIQARPATWTARPRVRASADHGRRRRTSTSTASRILDIASKSDLGSTATSSRSSASARSRSSRARHRGEPDRRRRRVGRGHRSGAVRPPKPPRRSADAVRRHPLRAAESAICRGRGRGAAASARCA